VAQATALKVKKYDVLRRLINLQRTLGHKSKPCRVVPAVVSHRGELASELIDLVERSAGRVKSAAIKSPNRVDGLTPVQAAAKFRSAFMTRIFVALVKGWGSQLYNAGWPFNSRSH
jgi:hypothetical protein